MSMNEPAELAQSNMWELKEAAVEFWRRSMQGGLSYEVLERTRASSYILEHRHGI